MTPRFRIRLTDGSTMLATDVSTTDGWIHADAIRFQDEIVDDRNVHRTPHHVEAVIIPARRIRRIAAIGGQG